ncbi:MAG TPA: iron-containing alcohol dehydrogenase [Feifaniaceae bacterium]|nr:iron-containing alcohol dehydrogenase [Feifaniaceae bacterium]
MSNIRQALEALPEALRQEITIQFPGTKPNGRLLFGFGAAQKAGKTAQALGGTTALIVTDKTIVSLGMHQTVMESLAASGIGAFVYSDVAPEPHMDNLRDVERLVKEKGIDIVIGLGGGSSMDVGKLAGVVAKSEHDADALMRDGGLITGSLPTILMPTTSGTGSEVSPYIVASDNGKKLYIASPHLYADAALVDPLLTATMPPRVTAATGLDALTHGVEGVCGQTNPFTLAMAAQCVELVFTYLPLAIENGDNLAARYYMSFASVMGMLAYTQGGGLYAHSVSYILTTEKGAPHGLGCALALPYTLAYNKKQIAPVLDALAPAINRSGRFHTENAEQTIACFSELVKLSGLPVTLRELGYTPDDAAGFAQKLMEEYFRPKNPRRMDKAGALALTNNMINGILDGNL